MMVMDSGLDDIVVQDGIFTVFQPLRLPFGMALSTAVTL